MDNNDTLENYLYKALSQPLCEIDASTLQGEQNIF